MAGVESFVVWRRSVLALCFLLTACSPKPVSMSVATFKPGDWELGESKDCQKAEWQGGTILLCDIEEYDAEVASLSRLPESEAAIQSDRMRSRKDDAEIFAIRFYSSAVAIYKCQRTAEGLDCR
jgi:hypothetical protein